MIRRCRDDELAAIFAIVNAAADVYRGVIPEDRWHEPYMRMDGARSARSPRASSSGARRRTMSCSGIMGIQPVRDVSLIRHAYVAPAAQGRGVGGALLAELEARGDRQLLVGTWAAASWAIGFYARRGFVDVWPERTAELLREYWSIPERQIETSVVLAKPALS